ncbi:MAG: hypothetical protein ACI9ZD_002684 [Paracoccaceae bacterium]|jgi:hypothetical protein
MPLVDNKPSVPKPWFDPKTRITNHLAEVVRQELSNADGFKNPKLGFIQALNNI